MTADTSTTRVVTTSGADVGPGERLREAREAAQLTVSEVASRLRLEPRVIAWLENDDYEQLHGPTFVRGYLSGYARLLDLPEGPILEAYERHGFGPPALVSELGRKPEVHVSDFPVRMVTYVIAGLLVVLVVLWWQSRQIDTGAPERADIGATSGDTASQAAATQSSDEISTSPSAPTTGSPVTDTTTSTVSAAQTPPRAAETASDAAVEEREAQPPEVAADLQSSGETPPVAETLPSDNADAGDTPEQAEPPLQIEPIPVIGFVAEAQPADTEADASRDVPATTDSDESGSATEAVAMTAEQDSAPSSPDAEGVAEAAPAPPPAPLPGSDVLAIQLTRESWIEIYDRGGGRLYYSLAGEGSEIVVQGAGPMRVLLGEVEGAAVAYNGEPYDLSRFEGRSVVRFTVGELSDTATPEPPEPTAADEPLTRETQQPTAEGQGRSVADAGEALTVPASPPEAAAVTPAIEPAPQPSSAAPAAGALRPDS